MFRWRNNSNEDEVEILRRKLKKLGLLEKKKKRERNIGRDLKRILKALMSIRSPKDYKILANALFLEFRRIFPTIFERMKINVERADIDMLPETYFSLSFAVSFLLGVIGYVFARVEMFIFNVSEPKATLLSIILPVIFAVGTFVFFYLYPLQRISNKKASIDSNLPFALNHMAAIASSGVPPEKAFEMLSEFKEYGGVSVESKKIVERIKVFGEDITTAIREIGRTTPSQKLKDLLYGILAVIESGGNLRAYLNEMAQLMLFNYRIERKKYLEALSTYADIYTAILIVAPLFLVSILTVMNIIPGSRFAGIDLNTIMKLGIYVLIPLLNIGFLLFISFTQPEM